MPDTVSISQGRQVGYGCGRKPPAREDYAEDDNSHLVPAHGRIVASVEPGSPACQPGDAQLLRPRGGQTAGVRGQGADRTGGVQPSGGWPPGSGQQLRRHSSAGFRAPPPPLGVNAPGPPFGTWRQTHGDRDRASDGGRAGPYQAAFRRAVHATARMRSDLASAGEFRCHTTCTQSRVAAKKAAAARAGRRG